MSLKFIVGGRIFQTKCTPEQIEENRERALSKARRNRNRNVARELKEAGMLPNEPGSPFAGWQGSNTHCDHAIPSTGTEYTASERFDQFLAQNKAEENASKQSLVF
jgi:hypothetical protein